MNDQVAVPAIVSQMTANVNVGIDEVVSVFVAKWEDGLHAKRENLAKQIKVTKQQQQDLTDRLEASVDKSQYEMKNTVLGIEAQVEGVDVELGLKENRIVVRVEISDTDSKRSYGDSFDKFFYLPISAEDVQLYNDLKNELTQLQADLLQVMTEIKSVSRKERQVRGRISEMKLEQSGLTELLSNPSMLQLIEVK